MILIMAKMAHKKEKYYKYDILVARISFNFSVIIPKINSSVTIPNDALELNFIIISYVHLL